MIWLYIKAFHVIAMVAWFAGLFYLPRLFVYHAMTNDLPTIQQFKIMERKLLFAITTPAAIVTIVLGICLYWHQAAFYYHATWMTIKLMAVLLLLVFHITCIYYWLQFKKDSNKRSQKFFRYYNEIPTLFLMVIIIMVVVRPIF